MIPPRGYRWIHRTVPGGEIVFLIRWTYFRKRRLVASEFFSYPKGSGKYIIERRHMVKSMILLEHGLLEV